MSLTVLPAASADQADSRGLTLTSSGISRVALATDRNSTSGWITFKVKDARGLARNISECQVTSGGRRVNCDAYPLRSTSYRDGSWKVRQAPGGWEIRIFVGWLEVTSEQCLSLQTPQSWGVQIGLLSQGERLLTRRTHSYRAQCDGVAARMTGPSVMVTRAGMSSLPFRVSATILDRRGSTREVRRCFYDVELREPMNCFTDSISSVAKRTATGWTFSRNLTLNEPSRYECREFLREQPRRQYRLTFLDASGDPIGSTSLTYRLTCRM